LCWLSLWFYRWRIIYGARIVVDRVMAPRDGKLFYARESYFSFEGLPGTGTFVDPVWVKLFISVYWIV